jgi:hypothetical protein
LRKRGYLSEHATEVERPDCVDKAFADSEQLTAAVSGTRRSTVLSRGRSVLLPTASRFTRIVISANKNAKSSKTLSHTHHGRPFPTSIYRLKTPTTQVAICFTR